MPPEMTPEEQAAAEQLADAALAAGGVSPQPATQAAPAAPAAAPQPVAQPGATDPNHPAGMSADEMQALVKRHGGKVLGVVPVDTFHTIEEPLPDGPERSMAEALGKPTTRQVRRPNPNPTEYKIVFSDGKTLSVKPHGHDLKDPLNTAKWFEVAQPGTAFQTKDDADVTTTAKQAAAAANTARAGDLAAQARQRDWLQTFKEAHEGLDPNQWALKHTGALKVDYDKGQDDIRNKLSDRRISVQEAIAQSTQLHQQAQAALQDAQLQTRRDEMAARAAADKATFGANVAQTVAGAVNNHMGRTISRTEAANLDKALNWLANPGGPKPRFDLNSAADSTMDPQKMVMDAVKQAMSMYSPAVAQATGRPVSNDNGFNALAARALHGRDMAGLPGSGAPTPEGMAGAKNDSEQPFIDAGGAVTPEGIASARNSSEQPFIAAPQPGNPAANAYPGDQGSTPSAFAVPPFTGDATSGGPGPIFPQGDGGPIAAEIARRLQAGAADQGGVYDAKAPGGFERGVPAGMVLDPRTGRYSYGHVAMGTAFQTPQGGW